MDTSGDRRSARSGGRWATLLMGASVLALAAGSPAWAQAASSTPAPKSAAAAPADDATSMGEVVVTAIRRSLASSQALKQDSATVVDAITAEDIGALPDRSVTETLQRIPGVAINRFENSNDPDHFSPEGQGVVIRGLPYVESQFNGRDAFTASRGRAISFQDIPPELLSRIEVYKNQTADQIEGGIAGNVNLVTRRPLDTNKDLFAFTVQGNYGDLDEKWAPEASVLGSKQWDTSIGRIGILGSVSYSRLYTRSDGVEISSWTPRPGSTLPGATAGQTYYIPVGGGYRQQEFDRKRTGYSAALQWESLDKKWLATFQFLRTKTTQQWNEDTFESVQDFGAENLVPVAGQPLTFDSQRRLTQGTFTFGGPGNQGGVPNNGIAQVSESRGVDEGSTTNDYSGHLRWQATDRLKFDFDFQYTNSTAFDTDLGLYTDTRGDEQFDLRGSVPKFTRLVPAGAIYSSFTDPRSSYYRAAIDHIEQDDGKEYAAKIDGEFDFGADSFLRDVKFGVRYADRSQKVRSDAYNWNHISETWDGTGAVFVSQISPPGIGLHDFGRNFFRGDATATPVFGYLPNAGANYAKAIATIRAIEAFADLRGNSCCGRFGPLSTRDGVLPVSMGGDGIHRPSEISDNDEKTYAAYTRFDFGWKNIAALRGAGIDGNVGVRYVRTESSSNGFLQFPFASNVFSQSVVCPPPAGVVTAPSAYNICSNTPAQRAALIAFADGSFAANKVSQSFDDFLPSVNLRLSVSPQLQFRFAWARALTRPSFNDLLNYASFSLYTPATTGLNNPIPGYQAYASGNPRLRPTKADNFDWTAEWYFSKVGSLTAGVFYKKLTNVYSVSNGQTSLDPNGVPINLDSGTAGGLVNYTNASGTTLPVVFFGTFNNNREVNVKGIELAYQQVYTFLPAPFDGLGLNVNATYIDADKLDGQANIYKLTLPFPGVSRYNVNAAIFYEKYGISARMAYNWRSQYLITARDVVFPNQPTYQAENGQLDGSLFYTVTPHIKVGIEGNNILATTAENLVQINAAGLKATRALFQTDRRLTLALRASF